jgi:DNA (cytosine-5)-methyltransferase 1
MDLGFVEAGFQIIWANEISRSACMVYEENLRLKPVCQDIRKNKTFPKADVLIACNPCQGFSLIGKRDEYDNRNLLYKEILRCVNKVKPNYVVIENVRGLVSLYEGKYLRHMLRGLARAGYKVQWQILDAKDYGVPQTRKRVVIVGVKESLGISYAFPSKTHGSGLRPYVSLRDAIGKMDEPSKDEYYAKDTWPFFYMSRNRRADWDSVSYTIQAHSQNIPIHPGCPPLKFVKKNQFEFTEDRKKYRRLSVRECARIQTFPDSFRFIGALQTKYRHIGNAVPPLLAKKIAESIKRLEFKS